jgi:hypothetical protein
MQCCLVLLHHLRSSKQRAVQSRPAAITKSIRLLALVRLPLQMPPLVKLLIILSSLAAAGVVKVVVVVLCPVAVAAQGAINILQGNPYLCRAILSQLVVVGLRTVTAQTLQLFLLHQQPEAVVATTLMLLLLNLAAQVVAAILEAELLLGGLEQQGKAIMAATEEQTIQMELRAAAVVAL